MVRRVLPTDVVAEVQSYEDGPGLIRWRAVARSAMPRDQLWEILCKCRWGVSRSQLSHAPPSGLLLYRNLQESYCRLQDDECVKEGVAHLQVSHKVATRLFFAHGRVRARSF